MAAGRCRRATPTRRSGDVDLELRAQALEDRGEDPGHLHLAHPEPAPDLHLRAAIDVVEVQDPALHAVEVVHRSAQVDPADFDSFWNATLASSRAAAPAGARLDAVEVGLRTLDVFDVTALVQAGDTSATITATSASDVYHLTTLVASVPTLAPLFGRSSMSVTHLDGGLPMPGDELLYSVSVANSGSDTAAQSVFTDPIPGGTAYVPGSLEILAGANAGPKSDAVGDDQAEFDAEHEQLVWTHPGVNNWYRNKSGRVVTNNPWRLSRYRNMTATFDLTEYEIKTAGANA